MKPILIESIKNNLRTLRLKDMANDLDAILEIAQREKQGHLEFLEALVNKQVEGLQARSLERRIKQGNFPRNMNFENFDWNFQPGLNVENLKNLKTLSFIGNHNPLLIFGKNGCGKTHIATSLGIEACHAGFRVKFFKLQELLLHLYATLVDETTAEMIKKLTCLDLLIIDHIGFIRKKEEYPSLLLDLICACQDKVSIIITSSISLEEWGKALGNSTIINDIVDRIFHQANIINIRPAKSYRTQGPHAPQIASTEVEKSS